MRSCWWQLCYILAISFQLAGALLLIVRYWFRSVDKQLKLNEMKKPHVSDGTLDLGESRTNDSELVEEIWINRFAFAYFAIGYLFGIWGEPLSASKCMITLGVVLFVIVLVLVGKKISEKESDRFRKKE